MYLMYSFKKRKKKGLTRVFIIHANCNNLYGFQKLLAFTIYIFLKKTSQEYWIPMKINVHFCFN